MLEMKCYFKIFIRQWVSVLIFIIMFFAISTMYYMQSAGNNDENFESVKKSVAVVDKDASVSSKALIEQLKNRANITIINPDDESLRDLLYVEKIECAIEIEKGFEEKLRSLDKIVFKSYNGYNTENSIYINMYVSELINTAGLFIKNGNDVNMAIEKAGEISNLSADVRLYKDSVLKEKVSNYPFFAKMLAFAVLSNIMSTLGELFRVFGEKKLSERIRCGARRIWEQNTNLIIFSVLISSVFYVIYFTYSIILYGKDMVQNYNFSYYMINFACIFLLSISISFLVSSIFTSKKAYIGVSSIIPVFLGFTSGIFVPLSILSDNILKLSKLNPLYWYTMANELFISNSRLSGESLVEFYKLVVVQILISIFMFVLGIAIKRFKAEYILK